MFNPFLRKNLPIFGKTGKTILDQPVLIIVQRMRNQKSHSGDPAIFEDQEDRDEVLEETKGLGSDFFGLILYESSQSLGV